MLSRLEFEQTYLSASSSRFANVPNSSANTVPIASLRPLAVYSGRLFKICDWLQFEFGGC